MVPLPLIRRMTPADLDAAVDLFARHDWGDRRLNFEFVVRQPEMRSFVADAEGAVVGTAVVSLNGPVGWVGTIFVDPVWRRRGVGLELTRATIDAADDAGCRTLVLVSTDAGRPMYERLGFEIQTWYRILEAPGLPSETTADPRIRAFEDDDLDDMVALDTEATGEDRGHLLRAFANGTTARVVGGDGRLDGFVVRPPWGGGATIARDVDDAVAILDARRAAHGPDRRVRTGLLSENEAGIGRLLTTGWSDAWRAPRMIRGDPMTWHPDWIWGQFNYAVG